MLVDVVLIAIIFFAGFFLGSLVVATLTWMARSSE